MTTSLLSCLPRIQVGVRTAGLRSYKIPVYALPLGQADGRRPISSKQAPRYISSRASEADVKHPTPVGLDAPVIDESTRPRKSVPGYPLSVMPNGMLLRSLLVTTISSHRFLLLPSLSLLSFLSQPGRSWLLNVDRNPILHSILRKTFYDQFCAGENSSETSACVQKLKSLGFRGFILTYAKETIFDNRTNKFHEQGGSSAHLALKNIPEGMDADIEAWRIGTLNTADSIGEGDFLAIKLTGAGRAVTLALAANEALPKQMMHTLEEICTRCSQRNIKVIVDAESQYFQKGIDSTTLELMRKFNRGGFARVYNTYQAYLKGTPDVIAQQMSEAQRDGFTLGLKLVRGAYILSEKRALIHDTKQDTDDAYNAIAQGGIERRFREFGAGGEAARPFPSVDVLLASHNRASVLAAHRLHQQRIKEGLLTVPLAFGQLHGMSDEVSFSLLQEKGEGDVGPAVYKCSTWGTLGECLAYLLRRAVENRDAVLRTSDEHEAVKAEVWRRLRRVFAL